MPEHPIVVSLLPQWVALHPVRPALLPQVVVKGGGEEVALSAKAGTAPEKNIVAAQARLITTATTDLSFIVIPFASPILHSKRLFPGYSIRKPYF
jgi:hypothetical protein